MDETIVLDSDSEVNDTIVLSESDEDELEIMVLSDEHEVEITGVSEENEREFTEISEDAQRSMIRSYIEEDYSREDIFVAMCQQMGLLNECAGLFYRFVNNISQRNTLDNVVPYDLFVLISEEFAKVQHSICSWPNVNSSAYSFLDSRYAFCLEEGTNKKRRLFLVDNFFQEKREFSFQGETFANEKSCDYILEIIDSKFILIVGKYGKVYNRADTHFNIYLFQIDFKKAQCTLLSSEQFESTFVEIVFDHKNRRNFCIQTCKLQTQNRYLWLATVNECLNINKNFIKFGDVLYGSRLTGTKLQALVYDSDSEESEEGEFMFCEYDLVPNKDYPVDQKLSKIEAGKALDYFDTIKEQWTDKTGYLFGADTKSKDTVLIIVNLEALSLKRVKLNFYSINIKLHVNEDQNVLSVCSEDALDSSAIVYRLTLGHPEKLEVLALHLFRKAKLHKRSLHIMPNSLKPFNEFLAHNQLSTFNEPTNKRQRISY